ncbi:MAG: hypothetical protein KAW16_02170 [candidate division Zixibacteria bacterium]|nr:hypothetical protein [candidate division Zixibacteria bacterium]
MKKLFVVSVIFLVIGVASLGVAFYLYKMRAYEGRATEAEVSKGVAEEKTDTRVVYKKPETVDRSTPDKVIRSYWEYLDYVRSEKREPQIERYMNFTRAYDEYLVGIKPVEKPFLETFFAREALQARLKQMMEPEPYFADPMIDPRKAVEIEYRRVIQEVKFESGTRAKIECTVYNVTPIENLKQPLTEEEKKARKRGRDFVYTMEKFQDGWKIINKKCTKVSFLARYYSEGSEYLYVDPDDN